MYFLSKSPPAVCSIHAICALSLRLPESGKETLFFCASAFRSFSICVWSSTIFWANCFTSGLCALDAAALPLSISLRLACASCFIAAASALSIFWSDLICAKAGSATSAPAAKRETRERMGKLLRKGCDSAVVQATCPVLRNLVEQVDQPEEFPLRHGGVPVDPGLDQ